METIRKQIGDIARRIRDRSEQIKSVIATTNEQSVKVLPTLEAADVAPVEESAV